MILPVKEKIRQRFNLISKVTSQEPGINLASAQQIRSSIKHHIKPDIANTSQTQFWYRIWHLHKFTLHSMFIKYSPFTCIAKQQIIYSRCIDFASIYITTSPGQVIILTGTNVMRVFDSSSPPYEYLLCRETNREWKCVDTVGTVLVHGTGHAKGKNTE